MSTVQAYIEGFIKRASEYGLDSNDAVELLKYSEELKGDQHKLDVDHDGEIESEDLQKLREKNKKLAALTFGPQVCNPLYGGCSEPSGPRDLGELFDRLRNAPIIGSIVDKVKSKFTPPPNNSVEFSKQAKINLEDVENNLGVYLRNQQHQKRTEEEIENAYNNSFSLRHPFLTGIPTLGLAPALASANALKKIKHNLLREYPDLHSQVADVERAKYERELEMLPLKLEEERSRSKRQLMNTAAMTGLLALDSYHRNKRRDEE